MRGNAARGSVFFPLMAALPDLLYRISVSAVSVLLLSAGAAFGQDAAFPCSAFTRRAHAEWQAQAPVMLAIDGKLFGPTVGTIFVAGSRTANGLHMSEILDRECGVRLTAVADP